MVLLVQEMHNLYYSLIIKIAHKGVFSSKKNQLKILNSHKGVFKKKKLKILNAQGEFSAQKQLKMLSLLGNNYY